LLFYLWLLIKGVNVERGTKKGNAVSPAAQAGRI